MADATTTRYAFVKPEVGASADSWGGKLNTVFDDADALLGAITTTGSSNAYVLTTGLSLATYVTGQTFTILASFSNTSTVTINVDGLGAKAITKNGTTALASGDIVSGNIYVISYDGTRFQLVGATATGVFQPLDATTTALAALSWSSGNQFPYFTAADTLSLGTMSANALTFNAAADYSAMRTALGVAIGTDVQAYDPDLAAIAILTTNSAGRSFLELAGPGADRIAFWDQSALASAWLELGNGLAISGTTLSIGTMTTNPVVSNTQPGYVWYETDAGSDAKYWHTVAASGVLYFQTLTDAAGGNVSWLEVTRSGTTISTVNFANGTLQSGGSSVLKASDVASAANIRANTADKVVDTDAAWSAVETVALTDAATIAVDLSTGINFTVTLGDNRTLGQPTNGKVGQSGFIRIVQDGTGSRTLAYHADWKFAGGTDPTLSTAASTTDVLFYQVIASGFVYGALVKALA